MHYDNRFSSLFEIILTLEISKGVVAVRSAGNRQLDAIPDTVKDLSFQTPRVLGGFTSPLIVVGNAMFNGSRSPSSQYQDMGNKGILTLYNVGSGVECAVKQPGADSANPDLGQSWGIEPSGTSKATAITAGMIAYYLSDPALSTTFLAAGPPGVAPAVKAFLISNSMALKGDASTGDGFPRAELGELVPCTRGLPDVPDIPQPYEAPLGDPHDLMTRDVTNGTSVVYTPLVRISSAPYLIPRNVS
jgi:hypothetical protein